MERLIVRVILAASVILAIGLTGCKTITPPDFKAPELKAPELKAPELKAPDFKAPDFKLPFLSDKEEDDNRPDMEGVLPPQDLVALWSNTVYTSPGKPQTRGMAARLYFYDKNRQTIPVDGGLVVYGYKDGGYKDGGGSGNKPDRKYVFNAEQLASHYSTSEFGPSYSIWIPWDHVGGAQTDISLVPVFKGADGQTVMGEHTQHVLPGPKAKEIASRTQALGRHQLTTSTAVAERNGEVRSGKVRLASYQNAGATDATIGGSVSANTPQQRQLRSTSIKLPPAVRTRLAQPNSYQRTDGRMQSGRSHLDRSQENNGAPTSVTTRVGTAPPQTTAYQNVMASPSRVVTETQLPASQIAATQTAAHRLGLLAPSELVAPGMQNAVQTVPPPERQSTLDRVRAKANAEKAQRLYRSGPATHPARAWPTQQPLPHHPAMQPDPTARQSVPAW